MAYLFLAILIKRINLIEFQTLNLWIHSFRSYDSLLFKYLLHLNITYVVFKDFKYNWFMDLMHIFLHLINIGKIHHNIIV